MIRILKIPGRSGPARRARLERVAAWMAGRGWRLADFAEEAGSALFERPPDAPPLGRLDATRWLPGPRALHPAQWLATARADPRLAALPLGLLALLGLLGLALLGPRSFDPARLERAVQSAQWYTVTANQLNVREGPDEKQPQVGVLYQGQRVLVEAEVDATWVRIEIPARGYVARAYLEPAGPPAEE
jgi:hypothetical protein